MAGGIFKQPPFAISKYGVMGQSVSFVSSSANQWANTKTGLAHRYQKCLDAMDFVFNVIYLVHSTTTVSRQTTEHCTKKTDEPTESEVSDARHALTAAYMQILRVVVPKKKKKKKK